MPRAAAGSSAGDGAVRWVVPPNAEAEITALLRIDAPEHGWSLIDWVARLEWIDARYRDRRGQLAIVRLLPPHRTPPVEHVRTSRFSLARLRGRGEGLLEALAEWSTTHGLGFAWQRLELGPSQPPTKPAAPVAPPIETDPRELDTERLGFRAGLKPALRPWTTRRSTPAARSRGASPTTGRGSSRLGRRGPTRGSTACCSVSASS